MHMNVHKQGSSRLRGRGTELPTELAEPHTTIGPTPFPTLCTFPCRAPHRTGPNSGSIRITPPPGRPRSTPPRAHLSARGEGTRTAGTTLRARAWTHALAAPDVAIAGRFLVRNP